MHRPRAKFRSDPSWTAADAPGCRTLRKRKCLRNLSDADFRIARRDERRYRFRRFPNRGRYRCTEAFGEPIGNEFTNHVVVVEHGDDSSLGNAWP